MVILDWSFFDESEFTKGTGLKLEVYNPSKKKIKYLNFTFIGFNSVDDAIKDNMNPTGKVLKKAVGPINPEEISSYYFEYVWFTDLVQKVIIVEVSIEFVDGTFKKIMKPQDVIIEKKYYEVLVSE